MSPIAKMPGSLVSNVAVSTGITSSLSLSPQFATGPSFMVSPKNGSMASQAMWKVEPSLRLTLAAVSWPSSPSSAGHLAEHEVDLALADQRHHLVDAVGRGAEFAAPVQQREVARRSAQD